MGQILASGKTGADKYDLKTTDPDKVLPRLDMRQLAQSNRKKFEVTQGYSLSGDEGSSDAINSNSTITTSNIATYEDDDTQAIQTLVANASRLDVDGASTVNAITLNAPTIASGTAPDGNDYTTAAPLPFKWEENLRFNFRATLTNTGAMTLAIPGLSGLSGSIPFNDEQNASLVGGEIVANKHYTAILRTISSVQTAILIKPSLSESQITVKGISYIPNRITISNGTDTDHDTDHDIDFTAGNFTFSGGDGQAVASALTKQLDATFAVGDAAGGLADALTIAADTTYYCFALSNATGSTVDFGFDTSSTAANLLADFNVIAAGLTKYSEQCRILTDGSANIINGTFTFYKDGSYYFDLDADIQDYTSSAPSGTNASLPVTVPTGTGIIAVVQGSGRTGTSASDILDVDFGSNNKTLSSNKTIDLVGDAARLASVIQNIPCVDDDATVKYTVFTSSTTRSLKFFTKGWYGSNL